MKKTFFTPGPSELYPTVYKHIKTAFEENIPSISHRSDAFHEIYQNSVSTFKKLYNVPKDYRIYFLSSATEGMERILENVVEKKSFHFVNGAFSELFFNTAQSLGIGAKKVQAKAGEGFDVEKIKIEKNAELICLTQNETSTGVSTPMNDIYTIKKNNEKMLLALDIVSSAPFVDIDFSKIDCTFFSVQKGFGLPAGLGVVILKPDVLEKVKYVKKKKKSLGSFHTFENLQKYYEKNETPETPNVLGIYLFGKVCEDLYKKGLKVIRKETIEKAKNLFNVVNTAKTYSIFVKEEMCRSKTVIVLDVESGSKSLINFVKEKGYVVGSGYRDLKDRQIRIANFPQHSIKHTNNLRKLLQEYSDK